MEIPRKVDREQVEEAMERPEIKQQPRNEDEHSTVISKAPGRLKTISLPHW